MRRGLGPCGAGLEEDRGPHARMAPSSGVRRQFSVIGDVLEIEDREDVGEGVVLCGWKVSADAALAAVRPGLAQGRKEGGMDKFAFEQNQTAGHARALQTEMLTGSGKLAWCELDSGLEK